MSDCVKITIEGEEYEMLLTVGAMIEITDKYGSFGNLAKKLTSYKSQDEIYKDLIFLGVTFINQAIEVEKLKNPEKEFSMVNEKYFKLVYPVNQMNILETKLVETINKGIKTHIKSEEDEKKQESL